MGGRHPYTPLSAEGIYYVEEVLKEVPTMKKVSVLIPYKPDHGYRDRSFQWVLKFYRNYLPETEICVGESRSELFSRTQAINAAARKASGDVYVIADADLVFRPELIEESIELLKEHAWVIPFRDVYDLFEQDTRAVLRSKPRWPINASGKRRFTGDFEPVGGLNVIPRKNFEAVGGFDERFVGWGYEDIAFAAAMKTICGPFHRTEEILCHLWHPDAGAGKNPKLEHSYELLGQYAAAERDPHEMRKLIREGELWSKYYYDNRA